jgi:hypothetical protein
MSHALPTDSVEPIHYDIKLAPLLERPGSRPLASVILVIEAFAAP